MGTQGQLSSPSDSTVEGGPGLELEGYLGNNVKLCGDSGLVPSERLLTLVLLELVLVVGVLVVLVGLGGGFGSVQRSAVHVNLLSFVPNLQPCRDLLGLWFCELRGNLVVLVRLVQDGDEGAGVQGRRRQLSASARGTPRTLLWHSTRQSWQS